MKLRHISYDNLHHFFQQASWRKYSIVHETFRSSIYKNFQNFIKKCIEFLKIVKIFALFSYFGAFSRLFLNMNLHLVFKKYTLLCDNLLLKFSTPLTYESYEISYENRERFRFSNLLCHSEIMFYLIKYNFFQKAYCKA